MLLSSLPELDDKRQAIIKAYRMDEIACVENLMTEAMLDESASERVSAQAAEWVTEVRKQRLNNHGVDAFLSLYSLSSEEGIALMCLAEALLRVPDKETMDALIRDKLTSPNWKTHLGKSGSMFVNAATWGLMLTGGVLKMDSNESGLLNAAKNFFSRSSEPVIRKSVEHAMRIMGKQFVMGRTIDEALERAKANEEIGYRYSYDMLGEAAKTAEDAAGYFTSYSESISAISKASANRGPFQGPGISIKLSALHPRYEFAKRERVLKELVPSLLTLAQQAKSANIAMTIDAEESDRLDVSLDVIEAVFLHPSLQGWEGFGLAVQSYQKRAWYVLDWVAALAKRANRRIMVRLIKGAYWDSEIKLAQMAGLKSYPVFTRKCHTDISFQACAKKILDYREFIYPQFATHNAYSAALILEYATTQANNYRDFEFQCLHGMGKELYDQIVPENTLNIPCRIYAPVGSHENLLPYLVRRLLENGANSSFVNQIVHADQSIESLVKAPIDKARALFNKPFSIVLPENIFGMRKNSSGVDLSDWSVLKELQEQLEPWKNTSINITKNDAESIEKALDTAEKAYEDWNNQGAAFRANILRKAADLLEANQAELMVLAIEEAGKTVPDAVGEIREAVDFCRYYADIAEKELANPLIFTGYTGESNSMTMHGRGVMLCISPWNFPLAIFMGQVAACLVSGNTVLAKPAEQTPSIAARAVELLHEAGVPKEALHLVVGSGRVIGAQLTSDPRVKGVLFTGSTETAQKITQSLANRPGPIVPFVAETGGMNAMIVDSSALLEQVTNDVIISAFGSAGQRCSALRVLFVQEDVYEPLIRLLKGAIAELTIDNPAFLNTDIGPVIDKGAQETLQAHIELMKKEAVFITEACLNPTAINDSALKNKYFVNPTVFEISDLSILKREVFGPVLHVIRYKRENLDQIINSINQSGYGLTLGIHSRIGDTVDFIRTRVKVGNCYVNRSMIGAVVGLQPFGGEGLSGTGPKAGGPHYIQRLCVERVLTVNTTAAGGNASLMSLNNDE